MNIVRRHPFFWLAVFLASQLTIMLPLPGMVQSILLLALWTIAFMPLAWSELLLFAAVNLFFAGGDIDAVARGVFTFAHPDLAGLPYWEYGMWGFFVLLLHRLRDPAAPGAPLRFAPFVLMAGFMVVFRIDHPVLLTLACYGLLGAMLWLNHTRPVLVAVGVMAALGTVLEYLCVLAGVWSYPPVYAGGVAYWYAALFGATGYFYETGLRPLYFARSLGGKKYSVR